jgi:hypothetical protein
MRTWDSTWPDRPSEEHNLPLIHALIGLSNVQKKGTAWAR